jgi:hypothetical protein
LHIYFKFCILTHILCLINHLVRLRAQSKFILPCMLLKEGQKGSLYT